MNDNKDESKAAAKTGKPTSSGRGPEEATRQPEAKGKRERGTQPPSAPKKSGKKAGESDGDGKPNDSTDKNRQSSNPPNRKQVAKRPAKKPSSTNHPAANSPRTGSRPGGRSKPTLRQPPVDRGELESKAWALYCADINEEGTSMFNEEEAEDLVRRSFILSDIFLRFRDQLYGTGSAKGSRRSDSDNDGEQPQ